MKAYTKRQHTNRHSLSASKAFSDWRVAKTLFCNAPDLPALQVFMGRGAFQLFNKNPSDYPSFINVQARSGRIDLPTDQDALQWCCPIGPYAR